MTLLFLGAALYCGYAIVVAGGLAARVAHLLHLVMCVAMIAMAWPATAGTPQAPQAVFFAGAAVFFLVGALPGVTFHGHRPRIATYHAAMMGAMAWMAVVMAGWLSTGPAVAPTALSHGTGSGGMGGMDMGGMDMGGAIPGWASLVSRVLVGCFAVAALGWAFTLARVTRGAADRVAAPPPTVERATVSVGGSGRDASSPITVPAAAVRRPAAVAAVCCEIAMAAGMSLMFVPLV